MVIALPRWDDGRFEDGVVVDHGVEVSEIPRLRDMVPLIDNATVERIHRVISRSGGYAAPGWGAMGHPLCHEAAGPAKTGLRFSKKAVKASRASGPLTARANASPSFVM
jgi:hypothetical protein